MNVQDYGPFASVVAIAAALVSVFSVLLLKSVGPTARWSWLAADNASFMSTAAARVISVAIIGITFTSINQTNYNLVGIAAIGIAIAFFVFVTMFNNQRLIHTCEVPEVAADGSVTKDKRGNARHRSIVIGTQATMRAAARTAYEQTHGADICKFVSGYGVNEVNNPANVWDRQELARISTRLTTLVTLIFLCGVLALYLSAAAIEMYLRSS